MKKRLFPVFLLLALAKAGVGETVPVEKAKSIATHFFANTLQQNHLMRTSTNFELVTIQSETDRKGPPAYYIFNNTAGAGFVIIAGDDAVDPVIGYSFENNLNAAGLPDNFKSFLKAHEYSIETARKNKKTAAAEVRAKWSEESYSAMAGIPVVKSLTTRFWNETAPYNDNCPLISGQRSKAGYVGVAMAQIMQYWNYPAKGIGTKGGVNFGATTYNWANMPVTINTASPAAYKSAVATLIYHCGVSVGTTYGLNKSTAMPDASMFVNHFGYDAAIMPVNRKDQTASGWIITLKSELEARRPVLYLGFSETVPTPKGHAWVCDGYDNWDMFSMNWGWGGAANGYYKLTNLEPNTEEYQYSNVIIINIAKPNRIKLPAITSTITSMCSSQTFDCSVTKPAAVVALDWFAPYGWLIDGVMSDGVAAIRGGAKVKITPPNPFNRDRSVTIRVVGITAYGENTPPQLLSMPTGLPTFTKNSVIYDVGSALHCFTPTQGASMQILSGTVWKSSSNCFELFNGGKKTVTLRASNACGVSGQQTYTLTSPIDPDMKNFAVNDAGSISNAVDEHTIDPLLGIKIEKTDASMEISIYPNPATDFIAIQSENKIERIDCFNLIGEKMTVQPEGSKLSIANLNKGMYILYITTHDGKTSLHKFIKE